MHRRQQLAQRHPTNTRALMSMPGHMLSWIARPEVLLDGLADLSGLGTAPRGDRLTSRCGRQFSLLDQRHHRVSKVRDVGHGLVDDGLSKLLN